MSILTSVPRPSRTKCSATAFAYAAILDRLQYGTIPAELSGEVLRDQAANVAVAPVFEAWQMV